MSNRKLNLLIFFVYTITCVVISACTQNSISQDTDAKEVQFEINQQPATKPRSNLGELLVEVSQSVPEGMRIFEGDVFVASTKPITRLWKSAGWRIAKHPHSTDGDEVPSDCTLYPHEGVENQWIGNCSGIIYIPIEGAKHIAVVLTHPDGNTTHIQVSPIPDQQ